MTTTQRELRAIVERLPDNVPAYKPVIMKPMAHTATTITYVVEVPVAGTMLGVRFPKRFPHKHTQLIDVHWEGGEPVVSGDAPLRSGRLLKFWSQGEQRLIVSVGLPAGVVAETLANDPHARPYSLLVPPDMSGAQKAVTELQ